MTKIEKQTTGIKGDFQKALRKEAGKWLRDRRTKLGYTQPEIAEKVGKVFFTFISQIENGTARLPVEMYDSWSAALNIPVDQFAKHLMRYYDPFTYAAIFEPKMDKGYKLHVEVDGMTLDQWAEKNRQEEEQAIEEKAAKLRGKRKRPE